ncbi:MAG TPA: LLM class flavin-dependent oxidoreductase, partial [Flavobacteriales bacterium]|nr:LLM class flavin-dependent oxidoreductase [Flavobacteriales bacterium]
MTKLGVLLPTRGLLMADVPPTNIDEIIEMAEAVEDSGIDSVWVGDSLTAKPLQGFPKGPIFPSICSPHNIILK